jgi:hypothetical protein
MARGIWLDGIGVRSAERSALYCGRPDQRKWWRRLAGVETEHLRQSPVKWLHHSRASSMNDDYDTPWKDALTRYFQEFVAFYFPAVHLEIDWTAPCTFLEQELAQVTRDARLGCRRVDKLVRVTRVDGADQCVFVHVDIQGHYDKDFAERVFVYNYRIYDRYRRPVSSLVVFADGNTNWKPNVFGYELFGCAMSIRFPCVKLNDFAGRLQQLMQEENVFGVITAAHLLTQQTRHRNVKRLAVKGYVSRMLYERNWDKQRIVDLFNIIDWMMQIPPSLEAQLLRDIARLERKNGMPYMSSFERQGLERGLARGRQEGLSTLLALQLSKRFGALPESVQDRLARATPAQLQAWGEAVLDAPTLDSVLSHG